jgi:hypothetical protein
MRRLAIVKYLFTQGLEQERKGEPLAGVTLLPLHDAVESLAALQRELASGQTRAPDAATRVGCERAGSSQFQLRSIAWRKETERIVNP